MDAQKEITFLKEEINNLSKKIEELKQKDIPANLIKELKELAQKIDIEEIKEKLPEEKLEEAKEKSKELVQEVGGFIKKHPYATILGAAALGYLIGKATK